MTKSREPYRIGYLQDWMLEMQAYYDQLDMAKLAFDEAYENGLIDRPVELVMREIVGPVQGQVQPLIDAYKELVNKERCLAVMGPHITEVCIPFARHVKEARVPCLSYASTYHFPGEYCFIIPNGTFNEETGLIADHLKRRGVKRVGVLREDNSISDEYVDYFRGHCRLQGMTIVSDQIIPNFISDRETELVPRLEAIRDSGAEAIMYMAYGMTIYEVFTGVQEAIKRWNWNIVPVTITTWVAITCPGFSYWPVDIKEHPEFAEGWVGVDQIDEGNSVFQRVLDRFEKKHGRRPFHCYASIGYDNANAMAVALSRMETPTPEGLKNALQSIRRLRAATGGPGTMISFGPHDRRGLKGTDFLVLRTIRNGREMSAKKAFAELYEA
jgi:ABC-type branched-subunit amino acid transport system substrate-binding protein